MKIRIIVVFIVVLCCCAESLLAQDNSSKSLERDIKVSGNYYYGDGTSDKIEDAQKLAVEELKMMISESVRVDNPEITSVDFSAFDNSIGTISIDLEGYIRVIAFILKKEIVLKNKDLKTLMVIRLSPDGPEVESSVETQDETSPPPVVEQDVATSQAVVEESTPQIYQSKDASEEQTPKSAVNITKVDNSIINEIVELTSSKDVGALLNKYKNTGKLGYGRISSISDPDKCYFVVLRSGELVDLLDQGVGSLRKGLISGNLVDYNKSYDTIYWVYIY